MTETIKKLKICVFCSSSPNTNEKYCLIAHLLGKLIGKSGNICLNGAGLNGCMGSINNGIREENGEIMGVTHQLFHGGDPKITNKIVCF